MTISKQFNISNSGLTESPMLFAHGYGCDQSMWNLITPHFSKDHRVVTFDFMGMGKSDSSLYKKEERQSLDSYADDIIKICQDLNLKNVIFVGHSVSTMIGVLAAIKAPQYFSKLILIAPSPCYINRPGYEGGFERAQVEQLLESISTDFLSWARAMAPMIMGRPDQPELGKELVNTFCKANPNILRDFAYATFLSDNRDDLSLVKIPTLILQCAQDIIAPEAVGRYVHNQISGSQIKFLSATGHCPHVSSPGETIDAIQTYLNQPEFL